MLKNRTGRPGIADTLTDVANTSTTIFDIVGCDFDGMLFAEQPHRTQLLIAAARADRCPGS
ncbi:hypothetical protein LPW26_18180 [Rhodopseudomonas sp. HC1]|uniref:hypothetical protein n=1 Tax=Rhodopseudomonas infernalis TaxID=2897386 RepID=UPI001EE95BF6|nr:hypothetical protein [Rhodopseudomonas infernalis]MCG6206580.1 hypothetical protein [Rhodopseudomonas infernalis]